MTRYKTPNETKQGVIAEQKVYERKRDSIMEVSYVSCAGCDRDKIMRFADTRAKAVLVLGRTGWLWMDELGVWFCPECRDHIEEYEKLRRGVKDEKHA